MLWRNERRLWRVVFLAAIIVIGTYAVRNFDFNPYPNDCAVVERECPSNAKLVCDFEACNEEYPCNFEDYNYTEAILQDELDQCLVKLDETLIKIDELDFKLDTFAVDIVDVCEPYIYSSNEKNCFYTACMQTGSCCEYL